MRLPVRSSGSSTGCWARRGYGEKWGRHWLDVVRYADSTGLDDDIKVPNTWRYRDYVIDALNRDTPFDQFVLEQIAGDLLPADDPDGVNRRGIVGTGFLAVGTKPLVQQDKINDEVRRDRRADRHDCEGVHGPDDGLRPLPRPQVRSDLGQGLLLDGRDLRQRQELSRAWTRR